MCSVTVGGSARMYSDLGAYGPVDIALRPIHHGILAFVGFSILEPFVVYAPARLGDVERNACLQRYRDRVLALESTPALPPLDLTHYDGLIRRSA